MKMFKHKHNRPAETPVSFPLANESSPDPVPLLTEIRDLLKDMRDEQKWLREQLVRNGVVL